MNDNDQQPETPEVDTPEAPKRDEQAPNRGTKKAIRCCRGPRRHCHLLCWLIMGKIDDATGFLSPRIEKVRSCQTGLQTARM